MPATVYTPPVEQEAGAISFRLIEEPGSWPLAEWAPAVAGLLAGVFLTWLLHPSLPRTTLSVFELWALAGRCTIPVFLASATAVWAVSRAVSSGMQRGGTGAAIDVACAAAWFPPIAIFFGQNSPWCAAVSVCLATFGVRVLLGHLAPVESTMEAISESRAGGLCSTTFPPAADGTLLRSVGAVLAAEAGIVAMGANDWRTAALALPMAASLFTWMLTDSPIWPPFRRGNGKRNRFRIVPGFVLAVMFSAGGLTPYLEPGARTVDVIRLLKGLLGGTEVSRKEETPDTRNGQGQQYRRVVMIGDAYPAVILRPEVEKFVMLVPPLPEAKHGLFSTKQSDSLSIPFYGSYWFLRGQERVPRNPYVAHGDPAKLGFRTTDLRPLTMEARQNFGTLIDMSCCRSIGVVIRDADRDPDTVGLELVLTNTALPDQPSQSLGVKPLGADGRRRASADTSPMWETISFPIPKSRDVWQFDEATVRFHLCWPRRDRSARMAVQRLVFNR